MRKMLLLLLVLGAVLVSCKKEAEEEIKHIEINVTVAVGEEYLLDLRPYITGNEFPVVTNPPQNQQVSKILYTGSNTGPMYQYEAKPNATGDKVVIKIVREHPHVPGEEHDETNHRDNDDYTSAIITIRFLVK